jgi:hypothetical protein|tara:strand:+ start:56 stop:1234 length:1179 start_codon:yes stop_codon:yes gene_type:complete
VPKKEKEMLSFKKAVKHERKLRLAFCGPAGSGKTLTALKVAKGLGGRIGVIDTEQGSAAIYADEFDFDQLVLDSFAPKTYAEALKAAVGEFDVVIIDSLSHAWVGKDGALAMVDKANSSGRGGGFNAWRNVTPQHNDMVTAILTAPFHVISTMRSKMDYVQEQDNRGKTIIRKVGMAPVQRDGLEYEFDIVGDIDQTHTLTISKTRYAELADEVITKPTEALGEQIAGWLQGAPMPTPDEDEEPSIQVETVKEQPKQQPTPKDRDRGDFYKDFLTPCGKEKARIGEFQYYSAIILANKGKKFSEDFPPKANQVEKDDGRTQEGILDALAVHPDVGADDGFNNNLAIADRWFTERDKRSLFVSARKGAEETGQPAAEQVTMIWKTIEPLLKAA